MTPPRVRCHGCNKAFTPRGLAQHASKSRSAPCRASNTPSHYRLLSPPIPHVPLPPGPSQVSTSGDSRDAQSGDEFYQASGRHSSTGVFIMTHVPKQDGDLFLSCITI